MKRLCYVMLVVLCCILVGCGKSKPAKETEKLIAAIGDVTVDSEVAILAAEDYYETLTNDQKNEVDTYKALVDARKQYDKLIKQEFANRVLGSWGVIGLGSKDNFVHVSEFDKQGYGVGGEITFTNNEYNYIIGDREENGTWEVYEQNDDMVIYSLSEEDESYVCIYSDEPDRLVLTMGLELNIIFERK